MGIPRFPEDTDLQLLAKALAAGPPSDEAKATVWLNWPTNLGTLINDDLLERDTLLLIAEAWGMGTTPLPRLLTFTEFDMECLAAYKKLTPEAERHNYFDMTPELDEGD